MGEVQKHNSHCLIKKESLLSSNHQPVAAKHGVRSRTNNPFILLLLSLIFLLPTLNAQIKIEERVEIEAQTYQLNSPTNPTEPTFTYILSWPTSQYWRGTIKIVSCYGDTTTTGWTSGGYATITMPGRGHHIFNMITERWYYDNQKGWGWYEDLHPEAVRKVLINNQEWNKFNLLGAMIGTIDIPLLRMNDDICDSGYVKLEIVPTNWSDCEEIGWLPIDELKLRITKGTEFASFFNKRTNTNLGSQVQINPFVELENLRLFFGFEWEEDGFDEVVIKFNGNVPADSIPVNIEVEAEINGVVFSGENIFFHTDRPLIKAEINPNKITGGEETSINIELLNRCAVDPFTTLNIEIIEGQEFGNLINPYTNEKTKIITNLFQRWGYAWAPYLADNAPIDEIKEVTIRVSTSNPSFPPRDIKLYILPSPIYAYTVPEVLGSDEEAEVIIKKRNPDGTLEDFPPNQTFELAVLDGCVNGNFMVNGVIDVYFAAAQQPIKFVTADSIDTEFDKVLMRIGTDLGGSYRPIGGASGEEEKKRAEYESRIIGANGKTIKELREGFEKMIAEKNAEAEAKAEAETDTKEGGEPMFPVVPACAPNNPNLQLTYYNFLASVQDDVCSKLQICVENNAGKKPEIEVIDLPNGYFGVDFCLDPENIKKAESGERLLGGYHEPCWSKEGEWMIIFRPQYWLFISTPDRQIYNDFGLELCYDDYSNVIQFGITGDKLFFKSIVGFCDNLIELAEKIMINDTSEIRTKIPQDEQTLLNVINDLEISRTYGTRSGLFYFTEITWAHELQHKENFKTQILKFYNDNFDYLDYSKFDVSCEDAGNINSVKNQMKQDYKNALEKYEKLVKNGYYERYYGKDGENKKWNETTNTHNKVSVQSVIDKLQDKATDLLYELIDNNN